MLPALIAIPLIAGLIAFVVRADRPRRALLVITALLHAAVTAGMWWHRPPAALGGWLALDGPGLLFLAIMSVLFAAAAVYGVGYLGRETPGRRVDFVEGLPYSNTAEAVFTGCLLLFLATMSLVCVSQHFGLLWVAVEATTLASAPLIYYHRHHRSLEATWKYLLICSVGIALALLGNFFIAVAASKTDGPGIPLVLNALVEGAPQLQSVWLKVGFLCLLVGYGTKMGLAPMHTWLPDAHSEAPSVISALLSGALLNCAFLAILRVQQVCVAAGLGEFGRDLLVTFGLVSMIVAAVFIVGQLDFKRMLAYSSVEHMGILALGVGLGGGAVYGAMLHAINHSLTKAMLFFVAGNLLAVYGTKTAGEVRGALRVIPASAALWLAGFLAIVGSPPFGPFLSEFMILKGALQEGRFGVAVIYLAALAVIFIGMSAIALNMAQGRSSLSEAPATRREPLLAVVPPAVLGAAVLVLGLYVPPVVSGLVRDAARVLGGG